MQRPFVLPVRTALGTYVYEVNRNEIVKVNEELFGFIEKVLNADDMEAVDAPEYIKAQFNELQECGYLAPKSVERIEHPATSQVENYLERDVGKLTLQVTQSCNLRCKYCIYSENSNLNQRSHSSNVMSLETAKRAINFYRSHSIDSNTAGIGFYGGEPLLAFPLIKEVVRYAEEVFEGRKIAFTITTNATLMSEEMIDFMLAHHFYFTFSIDGTKRVQDKNRVFSDGTGSYDKMMKNVNKAFEKDPKKLKDALVNMVVDPTQDYEELIGLFDEPALQNVNARTAFVEKDNMTEGASPEYMEKYNYDRFLTFLEYFRGENKTYLNKIMEQETLSFGTSIGRFHTSVLQPVATPSGTCIPGKLRLFINCFGDFYPCEKVNENSAMKIGSLDSGFDYDKVRTLLNVGQVAPEWCKSCWAISLCSICPRVFDKELKIPPENHRSICNGFKSAAYGKIREKILVFENGQHMRDVKEVTPV